MMLKFMSTNNPSAPKIPQHPQIIQNNRQKEIQNPQPVEFRGCLSQKHPNHTIRRLNSPTLPKHLPNLFGLKRGIRGKNKQFTALPKHYKPKSRLFQTSFLMSRSRVGCIHSSLQGITMPRNMHDIVDFSLV
jgi:hypothetical protein